MLSIPAKRLTLTGFVLVGLGGFVPGAEKLDFNRDIQPILSENCYHCHGPDKAERKGGLRLDEEKAAKETKDGLTAVLAGKSADSEIIKRIFSHDPDEVMPTPKSNRKLTAKQRETLKRWIDEGAVWGKHWAFERIESPPIPDVSTLETSQSTPENQIKNQKSKIINSIDAFIRARLAQEKLEPSPEASKETLIRRVTLDLTGVPPTPEEVEAFLKDTSPQAYEKVVDRLLQSPRYGERWSWDWLDAARYADTNGYQGDPTRTMWPWRDWVVQAINNNMPYDQFTVWQIAGDLMPGASLEQKLATGFNRNHMFNGEGGRIPEETRVENVFDRVETTSTVWMGLTMACTKCHDHKFDQLTQRDYFALYDLFNQTTEEGRGGGGRTGGVPPVIDVAEANDLAELASREKLVREAAAAVEKYEATRFPREKGKPASESPAAKSLSSNVTTSIAQAPAQRPLGSLDRIMTELKEETEYVAVLKPLRGAVKRRDEINGRITRVMVMDTIATPRETFILSKGLYDKPTAVKVTANTPAALPSLPAAAPRNRLGLAEWLVARDNPLTARVTVNRFWQALFGIGLVKTAEDFGVQGEKPLHQPLLDWLAVHFMESGWDVKALHKLMVMSATYRQSSHVSPALLERDPENRLLARAPRYRLPSWMIRDAALFSSGLLKEKLGGPPVKGYQPEGIWEEATFGKITYKPDTGEALHRRTLYTFWRRIVGPTMLFDNPARQYCSVNVSRTNTPLHALITLNDITYVEAARSLAQRVLLAEKDDVARLNLAFRFVLARDAKADERTILLQRTEYLKTQYGEDKAAAEKLLTVGESQRDASLD
ncbi:MAG TPA: PSD1 and planctomycete cytochrome C domain-containing protein, partial [Candidatus Saccharimonadia bacterium]|nr:PSD1 and planctomycete cytochrome C domain-containing protein [Candidatus Saccharimonadia bacterium]